MGCVLSRLQCERTGPVITYRYYSDSFFTRTHYEVRNFLTLFLSLSSVGALRSAKPFKLSVRMPSCASSVSMSQRLTNQMCVVDVQVTGGTGLAQRPHVRWDLPGVGNRPLKIFMSRIMSPHTCKWATGPTILNNSVGTFQWLFWPLTLVNIRMWREKKKTYIICLLFSFVLNETLGKMYIILILVPEAFM